VNTGKSRVALVTIATLAKGIERIAYKITLLSTEVRILRVVNKALSKRRRAKKTYIR
jgi:hypothetical protein